MLRSTQAAALHGRSPICRRTAVTSGTSRRLQRRRLCVRRHAAGNEDAPDQTVVLTKNPNPVGSPFSDALLRSFALGLSSGAIFETAHLAWRFASFATALGYQHVLASVPSFIADYSPAYGWSHVAAVGAWILFYVLESVAIMGVLQGQKADEDPNTTADKIQNLATLPRILFPSKMQFAKRLLFGRWQPATDTAAAGTSPAVSSLSRNYIQRARPASPAETPLATTGSASAVMERSTTLKRGAATDVAADASAKSPRTQQPLPAPPKAPPLSPPFTKARPRNSVEWRAREIEERKAYLRNFWYAAALSEHVKDKPVGVDMLGRRIVLWRDAEGKVSAMDDACPHRGAPLSQGWVEHGIKGAHSCIVCPYHGWAFDKDGKLRDVPSQDPAVAGKWPRRSLVDTYPIEERGGFVWLFFGSKGLPAEERPPVPSCDELDDPNWRAVYGELEFDIGHWAVFENAIDMAHIHYLHGDSFGNRDAPAINDMQAEREAFGVSAKFHIHNKPVSPIWEWSRVPKVPVEARAMLPSTSFVRIELAHGISMITFVSTVPIDENRSVNRFCLIRNFALSPLFDHWARRSMFRILGEDKVMVDSLRPELVRQEVSVAADLPQIEFRKLRQEYIDMGYGVPPRLEDQHKQGL